MMRIERVGETFDLLGEGPLWDPVAEQALYWVNDSRGPLIRRLDWATGERRDWPVPEMIGSMALRENGGAIVALRNGVHTFDFETGEATLVSDPEADDPSTRFNDGKVDRQGRFLTGTMQTRVGREPRGSIYRLDTDLTLHHLKGEVIVANGPCFSPDGETFYFADTGRRAILAYDYDTATGAIGEERVAVDTSPFDSGPDGGTVDGEGFLWSALVHAGQVARFAPDGTLDRMIDMPCSRPASVMLRRPRPRHPLRPVHPRLRQRARRPSDRRSPLRRPRPRRHRPPRAPLRRVAATDQPRSRLTLSGRAAT